MRFWPHVLCVVCAALRGGDGIRQQLQRASPAVHGHQSMRGAIPLRRGTLPPSERRGTPCRLPPAGFQPSIWKPAPVRAALLSARRNVTRRTLCTQVRTILTPDLLRRYEKRQAEDCLMRAGLKNLVKCPFCDLQVEVPEEQRILKCPRPSCARESCKLVRGMDAADPTPLPATAQREIPSTPLVSRIPAYSRLAVC